MLNEIIKSCKTIKELLFYIQNLFVCFRPECFPFFTPPGEFKHTCMEFVRSEAAPTTGCGPGIYYRISKQEHH